VDDFLGVIYGAGVVVALWSAGLELGMRHSVREIAAPLRRVGLLLRVGLVDVLLVPLIVWSLAKAVSVPSGYTTGLLLVGIASGGPLAIKAAQLARADAVIAVCLVVTLEVVNVAVIPLWAGVLLPEGITFSPAKILLTLVAVVILPLAVGRTASHRWRGLSARVLPALPSVANIALVAAIAATMIRDGDAVVDAASERVPLVAAVTVAAALLLGWFAGGSGPRVRAATALVTGIRANALALAIAASSFPGQPDIRAAIVVFALFSITLSLATSLAIGRRASPAPEATVPQAEMG
jgi:BASS family bile acid:Na+ symporter